MTVLATTFVAQPRFHFPEWMTALLLVASCAAMLFVFVGEDFKAQHAKRIVLACSLGLVGILIYAYASAVHAAVVIECKDIATDGSWTQWLYQIFWIC